MACVEYVDAAMACVEYALLVVPVVCCNCPYASQRGRQRDYLNGRELAMRRPTGMEPLGLAQCPGKVDTGFPNKDMRQFKKIERIPIRSNREAL